ncbi:MAG: type II secretion system protein [Arcobacter sp.]|nr:type II secretion system protein [Arcobacter sp.]
MKKSFTLIELVIVIILTSIVTFLAFSSFNSPYEKKYKIDLLNIKDFLFKNFEFEKELSLTCIDDEKFSCYIFIDNNINKDIEIKNLFSQIPDVYKYDRDLSKQEFKTLRLDDVEYDIFFELKIDNDKKHKNLVLDTLDDNVYLFSSISKNVKKFKTTNEIIDSFYDNEIEVKDAF